jgi:hypothetical protein
VAPEFIPKASNGLLTAGFFVFSNSNRMGSFDLDRAALSFFPTKT